MFQRLGRVVRLVRLAIAVFDALERGVRRIERPEQAEGLGRFAAGRDGCGYNRRRRRPGPGRIAVVVVHLPIGQAADHARVVAVDVLVKVVVTQGLAEVLNPVAVGPRRNVRVEGVDVMPAGRLGRCGIVALLVEVRHRPGPVALADPGRVVADVRKHVGNAARVRGSAPFLCPCDSLSRHRSAAGTGPRAASRGAGYTPANC